MPQNRVTDAASGQIFTFQIKSHFTLTVTRQFQLQTTKGNVKHLLFVFTQIFLANRKSEERKKVERKTSKNSSATFCCVSNFDQ